LAAARARSARALSGPLRELPANDDAAGLAGAVFAALSLENALEALLRSTERMIDTRIASPEGAAVQGWSLEAEPALQPEHDTLLRSLHRLVSEGLEATRASLGTDEPLDLDVARSREIQINRLEAQARQALLDSERSRGFSADHMHVLEVVGAYEISGNHIYRLAELLGQVPQFPHLASA
jgi:hypothetical protein